MRRVRLSLQRHAARVTETNFDDDLESEPPAYLDITRRLAYRSRRESKRTGGRRHIRGAEIRVIQRVDRIDSELELHPFPYPKILRKPNIEFQESLVPNSVNGERHVSERDRTAAREIVCYTGDRYSIWISGSRVGNKKP